MHLRKLTAGLFCVYLFALLMPAPLRAQSFGLAASASASSIVRSNALTYTIFVTNNTGFLLDPAFVTNTITSSDTSGNSIAGIVSYTNSLPSGINAITVTSEGVIYQINLFPPGAVAPLSLTVTPYVAGTLTNLITVGALGITNVSMVVTALVYSAASDLAVGFTGPTATNILINDYVSYQLSVTNFGPSDAPNVVLSNTLPAGFGLVSVTPSNQLTSFSNTTAVFSLGTLASNGVASLQFIVQPTTVGAKTISALVGAANLTDPNLTNNSASTNVTVNSYLTNPGEIAVTVLNQVFNPQTGLLEMSVRLTNNSTNAVPAARLIVSGLPAKYWLYNASGTNGANAYVVYNSSLPVGGTGDLQLEYYVLRRAPMASTNYALAAFGVPPGNSGPNVSTNSGVIIGIKGLSSGGKLIEFPATIGRSYTILYSSDPNFTTNVLAAVPAVTAGASRVQWLDNGPPKTIVHPNIAPQRYYMVLQNN